MSTENLMFYEKKKKKKKKTRKIAYSIFFSKLLEYV